MEILIDVRPNSRFDTDAKSNTEMTYSQPTVDRSAVVNQLRAPLRNTLLQVQ